MHRKLLAAAAVFLLLTGAVNIGGLAFTDDADIRCSDAVSALAEAGIINGYPDGSFRPSESVSRAEAAKLIAYFKLGPEAAEALEAPADLQFDDVPAGYWASGYIAWGAGNGIISGTGDGRFLPENPVTAVQMAKLLLTACGFTGEYEGPDWEKNVAADADFIFGGGAGADRSLPATREEACLYMNNCMSFRDIGQGSGSGAEPGSGAAAGQEGAEAYKEEFAALRQTVRTMVSGTENLSCTEDGIVLTTVIDTAEHLDEIGSALKWMYLSTFLRAVPDYASSLDKIADLGSINAYAAALIACQDTLNGLLADVTEIRVSGGGEDVVVASGERGSLSFSPGTDGTPAERAFDGLCGLLENANLVTLGAYETAPMTYRMTVTLRAEMDDGSSCEISVPYTFNFVTA